MTSDPNQFGVKDELLLFDVDVDVVTRKVIDSRHGVICIAAT